jgi:TRAP-type C4-dicarboxylate transport system substrate-binding protein
MKLKYLKKIIPGIIFVFILSCNGPLEKRELKLAHSLPTDHPVHEAMVFMADRCSELSDGN